jgi:hypothetical protein
MNLEPSLVSVLGSFGLPSHGVQVSFEIRASSERLVADLARMVVLPFRIMHLLVLLAVGASGEFGTTNRAFQATSRY